MDEEKTKGQQLAEKILVKIETLGERDNSILESSFEFCEGYKDFLNCKTEREIVDYTIPILESNGYTEYVLGKKYKPGDRFYMNNRNKGLIMVTMGKRPVSEGMRIGVSHIDSPRLDFKPNPLFECNGMAYFKTHYYGGIKKYQWFAIPLSLHGVVCTEDGRTVKITIGEEEGEPQFCVTDLLPHLARNQMKKPLAEAFDPENLNILVGSWPFDDEKVPNKVKLNIMNILHEKYGISEKDFLTAELCAVPAAKPMDFGLDRSLIGAYGHDDSVCAYANLMAEINTKDTEYTTLTVFADKEETGSDGNTGMRSFFFRDFLEDIADAYDVKVRHVLQRSMCLSCDVNAAVDPAYMDVYEPTNCSHLGHGPVVSKYTGSGGKYSTNDASAETMGFLRDILDGAKIPWQVGELGKIDVGGGGTVASEISLHNLDTVDIGVPVLSMHAPIEVVSKADVHMLYLALKAFYESPKEKP
ncbi:MAG TPA: aminopeptidase [Candidatus Methanomethylophilaceae archaeon]|nr:aminopeptidase [Candidatus Methanomethylophilaceae archaeon]